MKIVHVCADWQSRNEAASVARLVGEEQEADGHFVICRVLAGIGELRTADEVWLHGSFSPCLWWAALWARKVRWMPSGGYDPARLSHRIVASFLFSPVEKLFLRRADAVVATCKAEADWIGKFQPRAKNIETTDLKRFFPELPSGENAGIDSYRRHVFSRRRLVHLLYRGSSSFATGFEYLERAVREVSPNEAPKVDFRRYENFKGLGKVRIWDWCDIFVVPSTSSNFGLAVAEALSMGKCVLATDGAPAWDENLEPVTENVSVGFGGRLLYVRNYRAATHMGRVNLLVEALNLVLKH